MHSLPEQHWGRGKTRDLSTLNSALSEESTISSVSPDLLSFSQLIRQLSAKLGGVHPDQQLSSLVELLEKLPFDQIPFGLSKIDGILLPVSYTHLRDPRDS